MARSFHAGLLACALLACDSRSSTFERNEATAAASAAPVSSTRTLQAGTIVQASPSELQVWVKPLADGSRAVLLFNRASVPTVITADWGRVGIATNRARVRDLWTRRDSAVVESRYSTSVPSHGVAMLRVWALPK